MKALVIPDDGSPVRELDVPNDDCLDLLQGEVGGNIQAIPLPDFIDGAERATAYLNEDGKYEPDCKPNMRATDFFVPGVGLFWGDYIAGNLVLVGFDPRTGKHLDLPATVERRVRRIEREAR